MGFSRQEYWRGLPFPPPGDLSDPGIEPRPPALQASPSLSEPPGKHFLFSSSCRFPMTLICRQSHQKGLERRVDVLLMDWFILPWAHYFYDSDLNKQKFLNWKPQVFSTKASHHRRRDRIFFWFSMGVLKWSPGLGDKLLCNSIHFRTWSVLKMAGESTMPYLQRGS